MPRGRITAFMDALPLARSVPRRVCLFRTVRAMDGAHGASMDGFTAFLKRHTLRGTLRLRRRRNRP